MHLDTVCTMIDYDKFTTHSAILKSEGNMNIFIIEYDDKAEDIKIQHSSHLKQTLEEVLDVDEITLIPTEMAISSTVLVNNGMMVRILYAYVPVWL